MRDGSQATSRRKGDERRPHGHCRRRGSHHACVVACTVRVIVGILVCRCRHSGSHHQTCRRCRCRIYAVVIATVVADTVGNHSGGGRIVSRPVRNWVISARTIDRRTVGRRRVAIRVIATSLGAIFTLRMPGTFSTRSRSISGDSASAMPGCFATRGRAATFGPTAPTAFATRRRASAIARAAPVPASSGSRTTTIAFPTPAASTTW